jgi:hypothetical protein
MVDMQGDRIADVAFSHIYALNWMPSAAATVSAKAQRMWLMVFFPFYRAVPAVSTLPCFAHAAANRW